MSPAADGAFSLLSSDGPFVMPVGVALVAVEDDKVPGSGLAFLLLARRANLDLSQVETLP